MVIHVSNAVVVAIHPPTERVSGVALLGQPFEVSAATPGVKFVSAMEPIAFVLLGNRFLINSLECRCAREGIPVR